MNPIIMALASGLIPLEPLGQRPKAVVKKKCFRDGCNQPREGNHLYCSKQCRELNFLKHYGKETIS